MQIKTIFCVYILWTIKLTWELKKKKTIYFIYPFGIYLLILYIFGTEFHVAVDGLELWSFYLWSQVLFPDSGMHYHNQLLFGKFLPTTQIKLLLIRGGCPQATPHFLPSVCYTIPCIPLACFWCLLQMSCWDSCSQTHKCVCSFIFTSLD